MAKFKWQSDVEKQEIIKQAEKEKMEEEALKKAIPAMLKAVKSMIRVDELTTEELANIIDLYDDWKVAVEYEKDMLVKYNELLYRVVQKHTSQSDWTPDATLALYSPIAPPDVIAEWVQPLGVHDAYNTGDKVTFNGEIYECLKDAVTHSPMVYPDGWKKI